MGPSPVIINRLTRKEKLNLEIAYKYYYRRVYSSAMRFAKNATDAQDLTQDTFIRYCYNYQRGTTGGQPLALLLNRALKDIWFKVWLKDQRHMRIHERLFWVKTHQTSLETGIDISLCVQAIAKEKPRAAAVAWALYMTGLTREEAVTEFQLSPSKIDSQINIFEATAKRLGI